MDPGFWRGFAVEERKSRKNKESTCASAQAGAE